MASTVTYEWYAGSYGGSLSEAAFAANLPLADSHVRWLCAVKGATTTCNVFKRAVCAALEAFAEYGAGRGRGLVHRGVLGEELRLAADQRRGACHTGRIAGAGPFRHGVHGVC